MRQVLVSCSASILELKKNPTALLNEVVVKRDKDAVYKMLTLRF